MKRTVAQWNRVRAKLKVRFENLGITFCEKCGSSFNLRFGHRYKRRFINTLEELEMVALLCERCDTDLEYGGHERLYWEITKIIEQRVESTVSA